MPPDELPIPAKPLGIDTEGWFGLTPESQEEIKNAQAQLREAERQINDDIASIFGTLAGQRVFKWLWERTILQPSFYGQLPMERAVPMGFMREGQNSLIRDLQHRMENPNG